MLGGDGQGVEGHGQDDQPVEGPGLQHFAAFPAKDAVPPPPVSAEAGDGGRGRTRAGAGHSEPPRAALAPPSLSPLAPPATQERPTRPPLASQALPVPQEHGGLDTRPSTRSPAGAPHVFASAKATSGVACCNSDSSTDQWCRVLGVACRAPSHSAPPSRRAKGQNYGDGKTTGGSCLGLGGRTRWSTEGSFGRRKSSVGFCDDVFTSLHVCPNPRDAQHRERP